MKRILILAGIGLVGLSSLAACSDKVSREKSVDNIVGEAEDLGLDIDRGCVEDLLDGYSDDELSQLKDDLEGSSTELSELAEDFSTKLLDCTNG